MVIVVDRIASRLEMARELGADIVIDASREDPVKKIWELTSEYWKGYNKSIKER